MSQLSRRKPSVPRNDRAFVQAASSEDTGKTSIRHWVSRGATIHPQMTSVCIPSLSPGSTVHFQNEFSGPVYNREEPLHAWGPGFQHIPPLQASGVFCSGVQDPPSSPRRAQNTGESQKGQGLCSNLLIQSGSSGTGWRAMLSCSRHLLYIKLWQDW